jgi:hypothetical protein
MKKPTTNLSNLRVENERSNFLSLLTISPNYFGNIEGSQIKPIKKIVSNVNYEQLTCVGYNPDTTEMEATFSIKKSTGYSGNLCANGSNEYVRFYMDFHDGAGFIDQGSVAINVHDIPAEKDCAGNSIFPLSYVATLKQKTRRFSNCKSPVLPTLLAILSWQQDPPANAPGWTPVWGSRMSCDVQLKPFIVGLPNFDPGSISVGKFPDFYKLVESSPNLTIAEAAAISGFDINESQEQKIELTLGD